MNINGVTKRKNNNWRIGIQINEPTTARALKGNNYVPIYNPKI